MDFRVRRDRREGSDGSTTVSLSVFGAKDFATASMTSLNELRLSGTLSDVKLVAELDDSVEQGPNRGGIHAHRCVLATKSDYFKAMFTVGLSESTQQTITIHGVSHGILTQIVDFIYTGTCKVTKDEVLELATASAMMQISSLLEVCMNFLVKNVNLSNIFHVWSLADTYQIAEILRCCAQLIPNYLGLLLEQDEFTKLPASMVYTILRHQKVNLGPEQDHQLLRDALQRWVDVNQENVEQLWKLGSYVDLERLNITHHLGPPSSSSNNNNLPAPERISSLPPCFSLIAVIGGFKQLPKSNHTPSANSVQVLDTHSLTWRVSCPLDVEFRPIRFKTVFVSDGMLYFLAKYHGQEFPEPVDAVHLYQYEPVMSRWDYIRKIEPWEALWKLTESKDQVRAMADDGREIYVCGLFRVKECPKQGRLALKVDIKNDRVEYLPQLPQPRYQHGAVVVNGDLFVIGGSTIDFVPLKTVLILRKGQKQWGEGFPMSEPRAGPGVAALGDYIYCVGGTSTKRLRSVERYHISDNRWESLQAMESPRAHAGVIGAGGRLFVFGGTTSYQESEDGSEVKYALCSCRMFDPSIGEWVELPLMAEFRCHMVTLVI